MWNDPTFLKTQLSTLFRVVFQNSIFFFEVVAKTFLDLFFCETKRGFYKIKKICFVEIFKKNTVDKEHPRLFTLNIKKNGASLSQLSGRLALSDFLIKRALLSSSVDTINKKHFCTAFNLFVFKTQKIKNASSSST